MRKGLTEMVFVLDNSGSMSGLEKDTIGGFNSMIAKQKEDEGEAIVTTVLFNSKVTELHDHIDLKEINEMTEEDYVAEGRTALLDAFGQSIKGTKVVHSYLREEDRPEKTIFVVITDGEENSSRVFTNEAVRRLVEEQKEKGWEFLFLGANIDAFAVGRRIGIRPDRACKIEPDAMGMRMAYADAGKFISAAKKMDDTSEIDRSWCAESDDYYNSFDDFDEFDSDLPY